MWWETKKDGKWRAVRFFSLSDVIDDRTQRRPAHFTEHWVRSTTAEIISSPLPSLTSFSVAQFGPEMILLHKDTHAIWVNTMEKLSTRARSKTQYTAYIGNCLLMQHPNLNETSEMKYCRQQLREESATVSSGSKTSFIFSIGKLIFNNNL